MTSSRSGAGNPLGLDEWSRYFRRPDMHGIEALHARFVRHRFSNHAHDYFVIGLVEEGTQTYRYRGVRQTTPSGGVFLVNAGESHTGEPATEYGYVYRTIYPDSTVPRLVIGDLQTSNQTPYFTRAVLHDPKLFRMLQAFHRALGGNFPLIETETRLFSSLRLLLSRYSEFQNSKRHKIRQDKNETTNDPPAIVHRRNINGASYSEAV